MRPTHHPAQGARRFLPVPPRPLHHRIAWLSFWLLAISVGLAVLAPFIYGACIDTLDCTTTDVVAGLAQLSDQLHATAGFMFVASLVFVFFAVVQAVFVFVLLRVLPRV